MRAPTEEELAAIAAAYAVMALRRADAPAPAEASRWRLAGRLPLNDDVTFARFAVRGPSRWSAAGRLDG